MAWGGKMISYPWMEQAFHQPGMFDPSVIYSIHHIRTLRPVMAQIQSYCDFTFHQHCKAQPSTWIDRYGLAAIPWPCSFTASSCAVLFCGAGPNARNTGVHMCVIIV